MSFNREAVVDILSLCTHNLTGLLIQGKIGYVAQLIPGMGFSADGVGKLRVGP